MFIRDRVAAALQSRRDAFIAAAARSAGLREQYRAALDALQSLSVDELLGRLGDEQWPGARPTQELGERGPVVSFRERWSSAVEAREWAMRALGGVTTLAVDGSQIAASKEFNVPVSLIQVAWFVNPHDAGKSYTKDVCNEVLTPDGDDPEREEYAFTESRLNQRRFALEMEVAAEQARAAAPDGPAVLFVDGSLVLSFIHRMVPPAQTAYLAALFGTLEASERHRVPIVGYVDVSFARDLASMLRLAFDLSEGTVFDAQLLSTRMGIFDRTAAFVSARGDVLPHYRSEGRDWSRELCFVYLQIGPDRPPARVEFPRWVLDDGLLDHVLDVVRAEVVIGGGYPYVAETADAAAVLTTEDRLAFFRLYGEFARDAGLDSHLPGKSVSKLHRR